jgi:molybdopterin-biosynthesis enzyme MoeA-like protein
MARIPEGARLIENPVSAAPGFSIGNVHVMAGVPAVFQAMLASVLPALRGGAPLLSQSLRIGRPEGDLALALGAVAAEFADVGFGSYPFLRDGVAGVNIVARSPDPQRLDAAVARLAEVFPDAVAG